MTTPVTAPPADPVLEAVDVHKAYDGRPVLRGVNLAVAPGERVAIMGPSGSGKTTLLNCLGGVDRPDRGRIAVQGQALDTLDAEGLAAVRRRRVGTVFQFFHLLPTLTVAENIEFPLHLLGHPRAGRREKVARWLERVRLAHRATALPGQLSGGEMQRCAIARALIHEPGLVLADEPTGNLDSANGRHVLELLRELSEATRTALVLVTHSEEAAAICHRTVRIQDGTILREP